MSTQPNWMAKLDFCWFAEDKRGHVGTFQSTDGRSLHFIPELVKSQYDESHYNALLELLLDTLPISNKPKILKTGFSSWDSARGVYEYVYNVQGRRFELAAMPKIPLNAQGFRRQSPDAFDRIVLRLNRVEYALTEHINVDEIGRLLVPR